MITPGANKVLFFLRPSPFFFFHLASNAFNDIGSVSWIEKKKKLKKKSQEVLKQEALVPQDDVKS